jgi:purine-binding chemotaxis protein CheW
MSAVAEVLVESFVLLRLGERRFSLHASQVAELVAPSRIFRFPHKSPALEGVILRRGRMIAVCDIAERLTGRKLDTRRFYLLATRKYGGQLDWIAIPVSGECELINVEMMAAGANDAAHVAGFLSHGGEVIEVLRLSALTPGPAETLSQAAPHTLAEARS